MKQNRAEDWKEKIMAEAVADITDSIEGDIEINTPELINAIDLAISKTEQHFKDIMPHESYVKRQVERERLAFADWLEEIRVDSFARGHEFNKNKAISYLNRLIFKIDAKIKELRSKG